MEDNSRCIVLSRNQHEHPEAPRHQRNKPKYDNIPVGVRGDDRNGSRCRHTIPLVLHADLVTDLLQVCQELNCSRQRNLLTVHRENVIAGAEIRSSTPFGVSAYNKPVVISLYLKGNPGSISKRTGVKAARDEESNVDNEK